MTDKKHLTPKQQAIMDGALRRSALPDPAVEAMATMRDCPHTAADLEAALAAVERK